MHIVLYICVLVELGLMFDLNGFVNCIKYKLYEYSKKLAVHLED